MAGDTGNPQCQPTDLSMKPRRDTTQNMESEKVETYDYEKEEHNKSSLSRLADFAYYYAAKEAEQAEIERVNRKRKARTPGTENISQQAIRAALNAITKSLTPTSSCIMSIQGGHVTHTPVSDEDIPHILTKSKPRLSTTTRTTPIVMSRHSNSSPSSSPELEIVEDNPRIHMNSSKSSNNVTKEAATWRFPVVDRPNYLDLRHISDIHTSPDSGPGTATPVFVSQHALAEVMASPPETPGSLIKPVPKKRKRKLGPGRGWKFHDLSNDGGVNKKRTYAHNKLENEILQRFQDRVCVKTMPAMDGSKDKLIIIEPSDIVDCDLVRCGTALRILFDKEAGIYKLQLLPYTLEEGPLSDQERVLQAVSKMLAENNEVLCPSTYSSLLRTGHSVVIGEQSVDGSGAAPQVTSEHQYTGRRKSSANVAMLKHSRELNSPTQSREPLENQRNRLLWSLNNDLTRNNNALVGATAAGRKICLMWHTPHKVPLPGRTGKKYGPLSKWCSNCRASGVNMT